MCEVSRLHVVPSLYFTSCNQLLHEVTIVICSTVCAIVLASRPRFVGWDLRNCVCAVSYLAHHSDQSMVHWYLNCQHDWQAAVNCCMEEVRVLIVDNHLHLKMYQAETL